MIKNALSLFLLGWHIFRITQSKRKLPQDKEKSCKQKPNKTISIRKPKTCSRVQAKLEKLT